MSSWSSPATIANPLSTSPATDQYSPYDVNATLTPADAIAFRRVDSEAVTLAQLQPEAASIRELDVEDHPNAWARFRYRFREPLAEFLGTAILLMFGAGVDCQVTLSTNTAVASSPKGGYVAAAMGWGIGAAVGVWASAGISGGHINPAVTLVMVVFRRFPLRKFPIYAIAQLAGAFVGSLIAYGNYWRALQLYQSGSNAPPVPGTAALFSTYPLGYMSVAQSFFDEFLSTAILMISILAITDKRNAAVPSGLLPLVICVVIIGLGAAFGMQTGFAMNPARDLGPRLMSAIFYGREVFNYGHQYWLYAPVLGPFAGALAGATAYDLFIYTGDDSRVNSRNFLSFRRSPPKPAIRKFEVFSA